jgi:hypothetical protein
MLPFGVTIPATVPQGSEIPEGLMDNFVLKNEFQTQRRNKSIMSTNHEMVFRAMVPSY